MPAPELSKTTLRLNATRTKILKKGGLADMVYLNNYFYDYLKKMDAIHVGDYARGVEFDLLDTGNTTSKWMNRYEKYDTTPGTETRAAMFDLKKLGATAVVDIDSVDENSSDEQIWDIVEVKTKDALDAIQNTLETGMHAVATDNKRILSVRDLIADNPTSNPSAYRVGGIDRSSSTFSYYRNQYNTTAVLGATVNFSVDGKAAMRAMWSTCVKNAPKNKGSTTREPKMIVADWDVVDAYEAVHDSNDLHIRKDDKVGSGFRHFVYKLNVPVFPDDDTNFDGRMYFINTDYFGFYVDKKSNFKLGMWLEPADQDAHIQKIKLRGVLAGAQWKCHGVIYGIS